MPRRQPTSPIPSGPDGRKDIMSAEPQDRDTFPGGQEPSLLGHDSAGQEDIMSAEPQDRDTGNGQVA